MRERALLAAALLLAGCKTPCDASIAEDGGAAHITQLSWGGAAARLTYEAAGDLALREAELVDADGGVTAELWGLPPHSEVRYQLFDPDGEELCQDAFTTGGVEAGLPALDVVLYYPQKAASWAYMAGTAMGKTGTLFVIDRRGRLRWHEVHSEAIGVSTVLVEDGVLYHNAFDDSRETDIGEVRARTLIGDDDVIRTRTEGSHHSFARLPDGTVTYIAVDVRSVTDPDTGEAVSIVGDKLVEVDTDGVSREVWSVWDEEVPDLDSVQTSDFYGDLGADWSHANGLYYSESRDSYLLSLGHLDIVYELDRETGVPLQRLSADDVTVGHAFHFQHGPRWTDDGTLLLLSYPPDGGAVAAEYAVSAGGALEEVWSYTRDSGGITLLGEVRRLDNGNTLINFGGMGEIREVTPDGDVAWQLNAGIGAWFGNIDLLDALP